MAVAVAALPRVPIHQIGGADTGTATATPTDEGSIICQLNQNKK